MAEKYEVALDHEKQTYLKNIEREMEDVYMYEKILHQDGWKLQKEKKNLKVSSKI